MTDSVTPPSLEGDQSTRPETPSRVGGPLRGRALFATVTIFMAGAIGLFALRSIQASEPTRQIAGSHGSVVPRGSGAEVAAAQGSVGGKVGDQAPALAVETISGSTFSLPTDKPVIVFFMTVGCGSCVEESVALGRVERSFGDRVAILAVDMNPSEPVEYLKEFARSVGDPGYAFAIDARGDLTKAFQATALDTTVVIDGSGEIVYRDEVPSNVRTIRFALAKAGLR